MPLSLTAHTTHRLLHYLAHLPSNEPTPSEEGEQPPLQLRTWQRPKLSHAFFRQGSRLGKLVAALELQGAVDRPLCDPAIHTLGKEIGEQPRPAMPALAAHPGEVLRIRSVIEQTLRFQPAHDLGRGGRVVAPMPQPAEHLLHRSGPSGEQSEGHPLRTLDIGEIVEPLLLCRLERLTLFQPKLPHRVCRNGRESGSVHLDDEAVRSPRIRSESSYAGTHSWSVL